MIDIRSSAKELAKEILEEMKKEKIDKRLHNTRLFMRNYSRLKEHIEKINGDISSMKEIIDDVEYEMDMDLLTEDEVFIRSMLRTKMRTARMLACIDQAMEIIEEDMKKKLEYHKFKAFKLHFIDKKNNDEITDELNCGKNSPKKWSDEVIKELNVLLWGIEALGI
jgi:hypothetical protein